MFLALPEGKYPRAESQIAFFERLTTRLQTLPGVESAAIAWRPPTSGSLSLPYELAGAPPVDDAAASDAFGIGRQPGVLQHTGCGPCSPVVISLTPMVRQACRSRS